MKYYFYSAMLIAAAISSVLIFPQIIKRGEDSLISLEIPASNPATLGIQEYRRPPVSKNLPPLNLSARAVLVKDLATNTTLYQKDAFVPLPIASTTKIMTSLVATAYFQPSSILTVGDGAGITGARVGFVRGENLSFRSVLYGMLLNSGNDAAYVIAENYPGGILGFVSAMNKKAMELNLPNTHFDNPAGFDSPRHFSSAHDLAKITIEALKNSELARVFATKQTNIVSLDKKYTHELVNLNKLLSSVQGVLGVKTGFTAEAKENLVTYVDRERHQILTVVLGSDDRFGESEKLIEWVYQNFIWSQ